MTRRIKRLRDFELSLQITNDHFICPPRQSQRNWLLNRAMSEFSEDLQVLNKQASGFVTGSDQLTTHDRSQARLSDEEIMEDWQIPIMRAMSEVICQHGGDVLEIGFGRGVASELLQQGGVNSHHIVECNHAIVERFHQWRDRYPHRHIEIYPGLWQQVLPTLGLFDGIFFHTYPLNEEDFIEQIAGSTTFAEHFFPHAAAHLKQGGCFTYLTNEVDSLSRSHQRLLFRHFTKIELSVVRDLAIPSQVRDQWWADSMVVVKATK